MTSQGLSRKRPAPESPPMPYQQPTAQSMNGYGPAVGPQLSDDQFLQWGQTAQPPSQYNDPAAYQSMNLMQPSTAQSSSQLTRRPGNQIATRAKQSESVHNMWLDGAGGAAVGGSNGNTTQQQVDSAWSDDLDELDRKAAVAKKEAQSKRKQIPPFVQKLSSFLEDGKNTDLIRWSDNGNSFIVLDEDEFAKTLIPELFKHNNYASFVRQLNMYGFHKTVGLSDNSMRASERKNKTPSEYSNPYFRRGHPGLLWLIQKPKTAHSTTKGKGRRAGSEQNEEDAEEYMEDMTNIDHHMHTKPQLAIGQGEATLSSEKLQSVHRELSTIRKQQQQILHMMTQIKREHEQLYDQAATFQTQHVQHEKSITAILTFLATIYQRGRLNGNDAAAGIVGLFANTGVPQDASQGNVVDVGDYNFDGLNGETFGNPLKKQPLLLKGPPSDRASTMSPNNSNDTYTPRMTRRTSQALRQGSTPVATVEEVFDSNQPTPISPRQHARKLSQQADIMSMIQNSNARSTPSTPADFSNVLNDLEHNGGNTPLTQIQRANMLQLMSDSAGQGGDNALVNATPPPMPKDYNRNLQRNQADLDSLARLQAEQDRSVQNLTELLQPLSPTGSIPGLHDGQYVPPGSLDIDNFLNQDYFNEFPSDGQYDFSENGNGLFQQNGESMAYRSSDGLGLNNLPQEDDDELFGDTSHLPNDQMDYDGNSINGGRVESIASSEVTTPNTSSTADVNGDGPQTRSSLKGRRLSGELEKSPGKRRKRND